MNKVSQFIVPAFLSLILAIASFSLNAILAQGQRIVALERQVERLSVQIEERTCSPKYSQYAPP